MAKLIGAAVLSIKIPIVFGRLPVAHRDALLARIKCAGRVDTAGNFGAEHGLKKPGCRVRVGATQMDVIVSIIAHCLLPIRVR